MFLALSICASTGIMVIFKLFEKFNINTPHAITVNYFTASLCGVLMYPSKINLLEIYQSNWFLSTICLGILFISIFNVMALTAQKNGLSVAAVAAKMSVIIPIIFGLLVYSESFGVQKITGIIIALVAVYLTSVKNEVSSIENKSFFWPIILFIGSGVIDSSLNHFAPSIGVELFSATIFIFAGIIGLMIILYEKWTKKSKIEFRSLLGGIVLGIVNYGSIYFLLKALDQEGTESSSIFSLNNVAIVAFSTLLGLLIFKERLSAKNWIGIILAICSIMLISFSR